MNSLHCLPVPPDASPPLANRLTYSVTNFGTLYLNTEHIYLPNRLGSVSVYGVAGICCHPRLEHLLPHAGDYHLEAEDMSGEEKLLH